MNNGGLYILTVPLARTGRQLLVMKQNRVGHNILIILGIANALDLTDRILPRLQLRPECRLIFTKDF